MKSFLYKSNKSKTKLGQNSSAAALQMRHKFLGHQVAVGETVGETNN